MGTNRQSLGVIVLLLAIGASVAFPYFACRGGDVEKGLIIDRQAVGPGRLAGPAPPSAPPISAPAATAAAQPSAPTEVVVHVAGAVARPGVYRLKPDARVDDAIRLAGGATAKANTDAVNLAARAEDGQQIYLPTKTEVPPGTSAASAAGGAHGGSARTTAASRPGARSGGSAGAPAKLRTPGEGVVDVNSASEEELQRLPGVGPSYAARIVQYRKENGRFASVDDLMNVSGIGPKKLEKMRPFVRVR